jgi:hypothetical protein
MTYRVVIRLAGGDNGNTVFDQTGSNAQAAECQEIFNNYTTQGWITSYSAVEIDSTTKDETIDFDTPERWVDFKSEMETASGGVNVSNYATKTITSEGIV